MLRRLSIRNIVLIDRLDIDLSPGLCVLTGETGAGKSIFLDALGLALGFRADSGLLGGGDGQAGVTAAFELPDNHPAYAILDEQDLEHGQDSELVLRRSLSGDGRSRAYVNDQPVSAGLLRRLGDSLIEIEGQFAEQGLMNPAAHRAVLDGYGGLEPLVLETAQAWRSWKTAEQTFRDAEQSAGQAQREAAELQTALDELAALDPQAGEIESLEERRQLLMNGEKLTEALNDACRNLAGDDSGGGADAALQAARRDLERAAALAAGRFDAALAGLERAGIELAEALNELQAMSNDFSHDPMRLESIDDRIHALRRMARKHDVAVDDLPALRTRLAERLRELDGGETRLQELREAEQTARRNCRDNMDRLSEARRQAARSLDAAVAKELPALKLEQARIETRLQTLPPEKWNATGGETVFFTVSTNPGMPLAPLDRIASGGELSRFMLALKVVAAGVGGMATLVFDEVDSGVGGAVAAAVGQRLARLGQDRQVLVITHSPQVAALGDSHWRVSKRNEGERALTEIEPLGGDARREEIARMLSAAEVTAEARAAAERLMQAS